MKIIECYGTYLRQASTGFVEEWVESLRFVVDDTFHLRFDHSFKGLSDDLKSTQRQTRQQPPYTLHGHAVPPPRPARRKQN